MTNNNNTNTQITQINFPKDMELRKIKKKKPKSKSKKKQILKEVKEELNEYDLAINKAKELKISLPEKLGVLPSNISQINSVSELQALSADLRNRVNEINRIINENQQQSRANELFGGPSFIGQGQRISPIAQPQIITPQPQVIQPPVISPMKPFSPIRPEPDTPRTEVSDESEKSLEEIRQEILEKLSPEQRAEAEKKLEEEKAIEPEDPSTSRSPTPITDTSFSSMSDQEEKFFEENKNVRAGDTNIALLKSPRGFYDLFREFQRLLEDLNFVTQELDTGYYSIPLEDYISLEEQRKKLLNEYERWSGSLNQEQDIFMSQDSSMRVLDRLINNTLQMNIRDIQRQSLKERNIDVIEVAGGDIASSIVEELPKKDDNKLSGFRRDIDNTNTYIRRIREGLNDITVLSEFDSIIGSINRMKKPDLDKVYNKLSPVDKAKIENDYEKVINDLDELVKDLTKRKEELSQEGAEPAPQPQRPRKPSPPKQADQPPEERKLTQDEKILIDYYNDPGQNWSTRFIQPLRNIGVPESEITRITKMSGGPRKRNAVKRELMMRSKISSSLFEN